MTESIHPSLMSNKEKFKILLKQIAVSAAMTAVPGSVQFIAEVGKKAYDLWLVSPPDDRESYRAGANEMSEADHVLISAELERETGVGERAMVEMIAQSLQGMKGISNDEALRSINVCLGKATNGQATITPQYSTRRSSAMGTIMGVSSRSVDVSGRSDWPQVEGFEINGVLGKGAAGVVYLAKQTSAGGRVCALKIGELVSAKRFQREVAAMGAVEHEYLIDLWGSGELLDTPPRYWIAMPNVGGLTLADLWRQGEISLSEKLRLMGEVLSGLAALHRAGLVHRDLKPANTLVTPTLSVRLADFGLSKEAVKDDQSSIDFSVMGLEGTPAYMSPEQVEEDKSAGAEVDVWAFGVMLYEAIKGERPFQGKNLMVLGRQITTQPLNLDAQWIPIELRQVLQKSLERDRSKRYRSAIEMERPYQEGASIIIQGFRHNELRETWEALEHDQLLLNVSALDQLGEAYVDLLSVESDRLRIGLLEITRWRSGVLALQAQLTQAKQALNDLELTQIQHSVDVARKALNTSGILQEQWKAWHQGLCELESEEQSARAFVAALQLQVRGEESLGGTLHRSLTAWGRAQYTERDHMERSAQAEMRDLRAELHRRVEQTRKRVDEVGMERTREFERLRTLGRGEGESVGQAWVSELERMEGLDPSNVHEHTLSARVKLESQISAWRRLPHHDINHDNAGLVWRQALSDGSLVTFCLEQALNLPEDPTQVLPNLSVVSPHRLGEVLTAGVLVAFDAALRQAYSVAQERVNVRAHNEMQQTILGHLDLGKGVERLQRAGHAVGFWEGFSGVVQNLSIKAGWNDQDRSAVNQALHAELSVDLMAYEELSAARQVVRRKRLRVIGVVGVVAALVLGGVAWQAEIERREGAEQAERERQALIVLRELERKKREARAELMKCFEKGGGRTCQDSKSGLTWVMIEGGSFEIGSKGGYADEKPVRRVTLKSFIMSKSEVTVAQYRRCMNAGACSVPSTHDSCNWNVSDREDHPINCVSWFQLNEFAEWAGGRLPSEVEWEYAARSQGKKIIYPWGDNNANCDYAVIYDNTNNYHGYYGQSNEYGELAINEGSGCNKSRTWAVCSKTLGNTEQGLCDMAGNVSEWTLDEYQNSYEGAPTNGDARCNVSDCSKNTRDVPRVLRGGSWYGDEADHVRTANRKHDVPSIRTASYGGRVLKTIP